MCADARDAWKVLTNHRNDNTWDPNVFIPDQNCFCVPVPEQMQVHNYKRIYQPMGACRHTADVFYQVQSDCPLLPTNPHHTTSFNHPPYAKTAGLPELPFVISFMHDFATALLVRIPVFRFRLQTQVSQGLGFRVCLTLAQCAAELLLGHS